MSHAEVLPYEQMLNAHSTALQTAINAITAQIKACSAAQKLWSPDAAGADAGGCIPISSGGAVYLGEYGPGTVAADICALTHVYFHSVENNHSWTCSVSGSPGALTLTASSRKGSATCRMRCYDLP